MSSGVENSGVPAETPTPPPQEEAMNPDTPLCSESERETSADEAEENKTVTISQKEYTRFLQLLSSSKVDERNNKNTPNVSPLTLKPKGQDMQEKPAALEGEKSASRTERMEIKMMMTRLQEMLDQTPEREAQLFSETTPRRAGQQEIKLGYGPIMTQNQSTTAWPDCEENGVIEIKDGDNEESEGQSPVSIAVRKIEGLTEALEATTASRMTTRVKNSMIEMVIGKTTFATPVICLFGSGDGEQRRAMLKTMGIIIEKEHKTSLGGAPTTKAIRRCLANGMKQVMTAAIQALGDALAEKVSTEATVAADAIQQDVEQTRLKEFDLHAFASQGAGGIESVISIIARVIFKINPEQLQAEADRLEKQTAKHCKLGYVDLVKMIQMQQQGEVIRAEGKTIDETLYMKDPITALTALTRMTPPTAFAREHMLIREFLQKIKDKEAYIKRVEIAMATQDQINRFREADASVRSKVPMKTDVLVATTTQTTNDERTAADDSGTKPLKENKPNQRGVKRQEVEMKVVRKHGLCRKQLMNIIREKMTPKEAMEACQKGRNDGQCKFCKSCGEIKPEFVQMAKDILGSKDDEEATAEQK